MNLEQIDNPDEQSHSFDNQDIIKSSDEEIQDVFWAVLLSVNGQTAQHYSLNKQKVKIGRSKQNDIVINSKKISKFHCYIQKNCKLEGGKTAIVSKSKNNCFVNNQELVKEKPYILKSRDIIFLLNPYKVDVSLLFGFLFNDLQQECDWLASLKKKHAKILCISPPQFRGLKQLNEDDLKEKFTCQICLELFYQCYSFFPCGHSYCGSCCSQQIMAKPECFECQKKVYKVYRNHFIDEIIEYFQQKNPLLRRSEEILKDLQKDNIFKQDCILLNQPRQIQI